MATITFLGNEGSPEQVEWNGLIFPVGEAVEMNMANHSHRHMMEKAGGNQFFVTDFDDLETVDTPAEPDPEPQAEYVANKPSDYVPVSDIEEMDERALREALKALGINPGGRSSVETLRAKLEKSYGSHIQS